jgi:predicted house-cleaning noncanonical NTP pyrophosphatase (MazG superfamily)
MRYDKLVRDRIPEIIKTNGGSAKIHNCSDREFWEYLKKKLSEETEEFLKSENTEELADILEVLHYILLEKKISFSDIEEIRQRKKEERGGFEKRIILDEA